MSLKTTENVYNLVIEHVIKEINDDPQMGSISTEAIEYLSKVWKTKLQDSGVYTPHTNEYQKQMMNNLHIPIRPAGDYNINPSSTTESHLGRPFIPRGIPYPYPYGYQGTYMQEPWFPPQDVKVHPENLTMFQNNYHPIVYDAKATLTSGNQNPMQQTLLPHPGMGIQMPGQNMINPNQQKQKDPQAAMTGINIKGEEDETNNNSKLPVKVPANGGTQGQSDLGHGTPKNGPTNELGTPSQKNKEKDNNRAEEETKKDTGYQSEAEQAHNEEEEDVDDADLFEYNVNERTEVPQLKEEHVPPPLPGTNSGQPVVNLSVTDLDPYNPQERPLDSDDDPDYGETPETTDILIAFHEKVHRHGAKWKVTLKQGIMNAKGKEYILSQITGDFDFM